MYKHDKDAKNFSNLLQALIVQYVCLIVINFLM